MSGDIRPDSVGVTLEEVSLAFGPTAVLKGVSLEIKPGEFFTFLGPSGSGKSTLLRAIAGFGPPPLGRIAIGGHDVTRLPPWKRNVGMVFQSYALWPHMTVRKNVAFGLEERRLPADQIKRRVAAALDLVGLKELADRRPSQLSGGQQQRVALARTIVVEPQVLLLDEPLSNLDAKLRIYMRAELLALQRKLGITTIFVTHDQEEALSISDRVAVLDGGVVQQIGTPMELYDRPANRFIANFVGTINFLPGTVSASANGAVFESPLTGKIPLPVPAAPGQAEIALRPHSLRLAATRDNPSQIWIDATVTEREFLGEFIRYKVRAGGQDLIVDEPHFPGTGAFQPGAAVSVAVQPDQIGVIPAA